MFQFIRKIAILGLLLSMPSSSPADFIVVGGAKVMRVGRGGERSTLLQFPAIGNTIARVHEGRIYVFERPSKGRGRSNVMRVHDIQGRLIESFRITAMVSRCSEFAVLPDGRFAFFDSAADEIVVTDRKGITFKVKIYEQSGGSWQTIRAVVRDNSLLFSSYWLERGNSGRRDDPLSVFSWDLGGGAAVKVASIAGKTIEPERLPSSGSLWAVTDGGFYIESGGRNILFLAEGGQLSLLKTIPDGLLRGGTLSRNKLYFLQLGSLPRSVRSIGEKYRTETGRLYEFDLSNRSLSLIAEKLNYPISVTIVE